MSGSRSSPPDAISVLSSSFQLQQLGCNSSVTSTFLQSCLLCCLNHLDLSTLFVVHTRSLLADCGRVASRHRHVSKRTASGESLRGTARAITLCVTRALAFYRRIIALIIIILRGNRGSFCFFPPLEGERGPNSAFYRPNGPTYLIGPVMFCYPGPIFGRWAYFLPEPVRLRAPVRKCHGTLPRQQAKT